MKHHVSHGIFSYRDDDRSRLCNGRGACPFFRRRGVSCGACGILRLFVLSQRILSFRRKELRWVRRNAVRALSAGGSACKMAAARRLLYPVCGNACGAGFAFSCCKAACGSCRHGARPVRRIARDERGGTPARNPRAAACRIHCIFRQQRRGTAPSVGRGMGKRHALCLHERGIFRACRHGGGKAYRSARARRTACRRRDFFVCGAHSRCGRVGRQCLGDAVSGCVGRRYFVLCRLHGSRPDVTCFRALSAFIGLRSSFTPMEKCRKGACAPCGIPAVEGGAARRYSGALSRRRSARYMLFSAVYP